MNHHLDTVERWIRLVGLTAVFATLSVLLWGIWRSTRRPVAHTANQVPKVARSGLFYFVASAGYFGLCARLWRPLPLALSRLVRAIALIPGTLFYFGGLALVLWGRLTLAQMYNVSSSFGATLYANHRLITDGPFAYVRHPMYLGILFTGMGGLLLYRTWTFLFVLFHFPALLLRARREEQILMVTFGEQWEIYCRRVPAWLPFAVDV